jgi:hypothetical protein
MAGGGARAFSAGKIPPLKSWSTCALPGRVRSSGVVRRGPSRTCRRGSAPALASGPALVSPMLSGGLESKGIRRVQNHPGL